MYRVLNFGGSGSVKHRYILRMRVDGTSYAAAAARVLEWASEGLGRYVCVANVHMVMEAFDNLTFRNVVNGAALITPDGMPLVWVLRALGLREQTRVYGPTLLLHVCEQAVKAGVPVGLYGGTQQSLVAMRQFLATRFPDLQVAYAFAPPFRPLTPEEDKQVVADIVDSGARILFVGLGCPKQEHWMAAHRAQLPLVQVGVGAAFDFHSGRVRQAPEVLQSVGLEWLFRLAMEPKRLWRRYLLHNPRFVVLILLQLIGLRYAESG
jgi:N-acetylglucosaminyldiphosphoundecaprenol N-acetyl-beta-D-mannosaminyltransferase